MLESKRIILRKIETRDAPTLLKWGQDSVYHKSAGYQYLEDLTAAQKSICQYRERPYSYGICLLYTSVPAFKAQLLLWVDNPKRFTILKKLQAATS